MPATSCLARGLEAVAAGRLPGVPKEEVLDALGCLYQLVQRQGAWMAGAAGEPGRSAVASALLAALHVLQVRPRSRLRGWFWWSLSEWSLMPDGIRHSARGHGL